MFSATDNALNALSEALDPEVKASNARCFRLSPGESGLRIAVDTPLPQDQTFSVEGKPVLAVPESLQADYAERTLDVDEKGKLILR